MAGIPLNLLDIGLRDLTKTAFDNDALPVVPPDLSRFASGAGWALAFVDLEGPTAVVRGEITSLEPVPEPSTLLLASYGRKKLRGN